ncbi:MAG: hypothetical protein KAS64_02785 [Spirochaetes bacterium]|nr:hypothetical protein [Spirochaetota bacterium]
MKKNYLLIIGILIMAMFLLSGTSLLAQDDDDDDDDDGGSAYVRFRMSSKCSVAHVTIYRYKARNGRAITSTQIKVGKILRGKSRKFRVPANTSLYIQGFRIWKGHGYYHASKVVRVSSGRTRTVYLNPKQTKRCLKVKLTSSSKIAWGKLYVDGVYKGKVRRSRYKLVYVPTNKRHILRLKRTYKGNRYERKKSLYVSRHNDPKTVFMHPINKGGSDDDS